MKSIICAAGRRHLSFAPLLALFLSITACCTVMYRESNILKQFAFGYGSKHTTAVTNQQRPWAADNTEGLTQLPPIHWNSSWIGNQWIPAPGYKLYSGGEMQDFLSNYSILFMGDSTARRTYATLYGILNTTTDPSDVRVKTINDPSVIDVNKGEPKTEDCHKEGFWLCRTNPQESTKSFDLLGGKCLAQLSERIQNTSSFFSKHLQNYDIVVFTAGPWELLGKCGTHGDEWKTYMDIFLTALFQLESFYPNITFVWRTWGYQNVANSDRVPNLLQRIGKYNNYVMERLDQHNEETLKTTKRSSRVTYIDWAAVMEPRMAPDTRIRGDINPHYGLEARLAFIQMLMNHLAVRKEQEALQADG